MTATDESGRSYLLSDDLFPKRDPVAGDRVRTDLWITRSAPASNKGTEDPITDGLATRIPPAERGGTVIRVADFPPDTDQAASPEELTRRGAHITSDRSARHPGFHATDTVDYAVCLEGEIWAVMDEGETLMRAGDVLIQRGTYHAWSNRSGAVCRMLFVLVDADPLPDGAP
ncbi:MAG: cupin domain-containing protein [Acidimicrobiales bacterium]|nr:cupin domain-containing protein [Acidimicrobiales bacterium]MBO0886043.1 cupin domain-containing protein [Acidimicrobiales bacterium]MBO0893140.1 cupin domain-containing protein [Acidimicrobiales bacterium]